MEKTVVHKLITLSFVTLWIVMGFSFWEKMRSLEEGKSEVLQFTVEEPQKETRPLQQKGEGVDEFFSDDPILQRVQFAYAENREGGLRVPVNEERKTQQRNNQNWDRKSEEEEKGTTESVSTSKRGCCSGFPCMSGEEFENTYTRFEETISYPREAYPLFENETANEHVRKLAENRGYRLRPIAPASELTEQGNFLLQEKVAENLAQLQEELRKRGVTLTLRSAYRSPSQQAKLFLAKLGPISPESIPEGVYDELILSVLKTRSIPGYSKHHTGYAVDLSCGDDAKLSHSFRESACYRALAEDNFALAKAYGFIPSYPEGVSQQGPDPEPWEFVWVGRDFLEENENCSSEKKS